MWARSGSGRLVRKEDTIISGGFDPKAFKAQLKEELYNENRFMMKDMMGEITKLVKEK